MQRGLEGVDIVMMLRLQTERMQGSFVPSVREYFHFFGLTYDKLRAAKPDALIMHPGPMNRGVEIDGVVADDIDRSAILDQVEMGVAVRMACLDVLTRASCAAAAHEPAASLDHRTRACSTRRRGLDARGRPADRRTGGSPSSARGVTAAMAPGGAEVIDARGAVPGARPRRHAGPARRARGRAQGDASTAAPLRRRPAASPASPSCPTPTRRSTTRRWSSSWPAARARSKLVKVYPYAAVTKRLRRQGAGRDRAAQGGGRGRLHRRQRAVANARVMRRALSYAAGFDAPDRPASRGAGARRAAAS